MEELRCTNKTANVSRDRFAAPFFASNVTPPLHRQLFNNTTFQTFQTFESKGVPINFTRIHLLVHPPQGTGQTLGVLTQPQILIRMMRSEQQRTTLRCLSDQVGLLAIAFIPVGNAIVPTTWPFCSKVRSSAYDMQ